MTKYIKYIFVLGYMNYSIAKYMEKYTEIVILQGISIDRSAFYVDGLKIKLYIWACPLQNKWKNTELVISERILFDGPVSMHMGKKTKRELEHGVYSEFLAIVQYVQALSPN